MMTSVASRERSEQAYTEVAQAEAEQGVVNSSGSSEQAYVKVAQTEADQASASHEPDGPASVIESNGSSEQAYIKIPQTDADHESANNESEPIRDHAGKEEIGEPGGQRGIPVVLGTSTRLWTSLVHVVPLGITAFIVYINFARWYWFGEDHSLDFLLPASTINNTLQFVAKVHELLVIASLGALTIKTFKRCLVESHLPLGLLTGAYRVGDVPYIFSSAFWSSLRSRGKLLALFVAVNTIVATLVGPASAILLVPELDWFSFPEAFSKIQTPIFYNRSLEETWPRVVSGAILNRTGELSGCDSLHGWYAYWCPGAGFPELWNWISGWESSSLDTTLTSQDPTGAVRRRILIEPWFDSLGYSLLSGRSSASYASALSVASLVTIGRLLNFIKENNGEDEVFSTTDDVKFKLTTSDKSTIYQPLVQTSCLPYNQEVLRQVDGAVGFEYSQLNCFDDPECEKMLERRNLWYQSKTW